MSLAHDSLKSIINEMVVISQIRLGSSNFISSLGSCLARRLLEYLLASLNSIAYSISKNSGGSLRLGEGWTALCKPMPV